MKRQYFGTDGIRGLANKHPITAEFSLKLGTAAGKYFAQQHSIPRVIIGKDTRRSCYMLESALTAGLIGVGANVMLLGPIPTPAVGMLTRSMRANFGIMISASHNPFEDNGIKLFDKNGFKLEDSVELEIESLIEDFDRLPLSSSRDLGRTIRYNNAQARYIEIVKSSFPKELSLEGLRIVVDCANGAAYRVAPEILFELGAEVISIGVAPNGYNINDGYGATAPENLQKSVLENKADIGIALDGDADRLILCDHKGNIVDGDKIIALLALTLRRQGKLNNNKVISTIMSNMGYLQFLRSEGFDPIQTGVGDRYVMAKMREENANLGGEQSGHVILSDYATTGDGLLAALQILAMIQYQQKDLSQLADIYKPFPQKLVNVPFTGCNPLDNKKLSQYIKDQQAALGEKGRILVRKSGTQSLIRLMVEAEDETLVHKILSELKAETDNYL